MEALAAAGISTGIHYPFPLHLSKPYDHLGFRAGDLPIAERVAGELLSLPMFPNLAPNLQRQVASELLALVSRKERVG